MSPTSWGYRVSGNIHESPRSSPGTGWYARPLAAVSTIFSFSVFPSAHDSRPESHRRIPDWSRLNQTNLTRVKMVTGGATFGFVMLNTTWPQVFGRKT